MAAQYDFTVTLHDLAFILKQIKLSESANNADGSIDGDKLTALVGDPLLPYGIRTVDGSWNNLLPGQELFALPTRRCQDSFRWIWRLSATIPP